MSRVSGETPSRMVTSSGWPDPTDWANVLFQELAERKSGYDTATSVEQQRLQVAGMVTTMMKALEELPRAKDLNLAVPFKHLVTDLLLLNEGGKPPLLTPSKRVSPDGKSLGGSPPASIRWYQAKATSVMLADFLNDHGFERDEADSIVAKALKASGHRRRAGDKYSATSISRWRFSRDCNDLSLLERSAFEVAAEQRAKWDREIASGVEVADRSNLVAFVRRYLASERL